MKRTGVIYGLVCPIKNRVVYVGQTTSPKDRLINHRNNIWFDSPKCKWMRDLKEKGLSDCVTLKVLEENIPIDNLNLREFYWYETYKKFGLLNAMSPPKTNGIAEEVVDADYIPQETAQDLWRNLIAEIRVIVLSKKEVLTVKEAADFMGVSVGGFYKYLRGDVPQLSHSKPNGKRAYIHRKDLEEFVIHKRGRIDRERQVERIVKKLRA